MATRNIPAPVTFTGLDPQGYAARQGWDKTVNAAVSQVKDHIPTTCKRRNFSDIRIEFPVFGGVGQGSAWSGEGPIPVQGMAKLGDVSAEHSFYANSTSYTWLAKQFDKFSLTDKQARDLGTGAAGYRQKLHAAWTVNLGPAGSVKSYDGQQVFSRYHPYAPNAGYPAATRQSNWVNTSDAGVAPSYDNIMLALQRGRTMRDPMGRPIDHEPVRLVCSAWYESQVRAALNVGIAQKPGAGNFDRNLLSYYGVSRDDFVHVNPWLDAVGTPYVWYLIFSSADLYYSDLISMKVFPPKEDEGHGFKHDIAFSIAFWAENWTGVVGGNMVTAV
jgi:hypothetical protein